MRQQKMKIDNLDLEIIKNLQEDARLSFRKLGKTLGVPHTTVFTRAERLVEKGVISKFSAVLHPHELGLQMGYVIIDAPPAESKKIAAKLASFNEVRAVFRTFDGKVISKGLSTNTFAPYSNALILSLVFFPVQTNNYRDVASFDI